MLEWKSSWDWFLSICTLTLCIFSIFFLVIPLLRGVGKILSVFKTSSCRPPMQCFSNSNLHFLMAVILNTQLQRQFFSFIESSPLSCTNQALLSVLFTITVHSCTWLIVSQWASLVNIDVCVCVCVQFTSQRTNTQQIPLLQSFLFILSLC